jgi:TolB protein
VSSPVPPVAAAAPAAAAAPVAPRGDDGPVWRPSSWHVGGAIAATLLAAVVGGSLGRWRSGDVSPVPPGASTPPAVSHRARPTAPEPEMDAPPAELASAAKADRPPAARTTPAPPAARASVVARPARFLDRHDVQADAVFSPSFDSNGSAVFFHAESGGGSALKRADGGGGELRVASIVDDGARNYHVQLSPDGRQVAFDSDRDGVRGVYVADTQGRNVHRVSGPGYAAVPTWSPDGRQLAFLRAEEGRPAVWNLWLLDRESGRQTRVTSFRRGQVWGGAWFADGERLAYSHEDRLILHDLATGRVREIASPLPGRLVRTPAVSPDSRWIVFQVFRDGVWLLDVERGRVQRILDDPSAEEFAWSPDGRRVAYHSRRSGGWNLWTMAVP